MWTSSALGQSTSIILAWVVMGAAVSAAPAADFCGRESNTPATMEVEISKAAGIREIFRGPEYVAYQDEASQAVYTFTQAAQGAAHPAAVCRKPVRDGDNLTLQMVVVCQGASDDCQRLESDFKLLNAKMDAAIRNEAGQPTDKKQ
jgi:hypothetical protein